MGTVEQVMREAMGDRGRTNCGMGCAGSRGVCETDSIGRDRGGEIRCRVHRGRDGRRVLLGGLGGGGHRLGRDVGGDEGGGSEKALAAKPVAATVAVAQPSSMHLAASMGVGVETVIASWIVVGSWVAARSVG